MGLVFVSGNASTALAILLGGDWPVVLRGRIKVRVRVRIRVRARFRVRVRVSPRIRVRTRVGPVVLKTEGMKGVGGKYGQRHGVMMWGKDVLRSHSDVYA